MEMDVNTYNVKCPDYFRILFGSVSVIVSDICVQHYRSRKKHEIWGFILLLKSSKLEI